MLIKTIYYVSNLFSKSFIGMFTLCTRCLFFYSKLDLENHPVRLQEILSSHSYCLKYTRCINLHGERKENDGNVFVMQRERFARFVRITSNLITNSKWYEMVAQSLNPTVLRARCYISTVDGEGGKVWLLISDKRGKPATWHGMFVTVITVSMRTRESIRAARGRVKQPDKPIEK